MATSMILTVRDQVMGETRPEHMKPRSRKSSRGLKRKKQPQRGLGVEQLERLRLQERWKMSKMTQPPIFSGQLQNQATFPFSDPLAGVPVHCCPRSYCDQEMIVSNEGLGFENGRFTYESSAIIGGLAVVDDSQFGTEDQQKELSSKPKIQSLSDHCDSSLRKELLHVRNVGFDGETHKKNEMSNINGFDFLGLNFENIHKIHAESSCFTSDLNKGAKIKQIHGKRSSKNGSSLVEYEFFPGTCLKEMNQFGSIAVEGEASCITPSYGVISSNRLDMSLKLSL